MNSGKIALLVAALCVANASFSGVFGSDAAKQKAETAVVLLNHLNWVVSRVEQNKNNAAVIEEEYENLTDNNINLSTIEDEEVAHEIVALMGVFTDIRKVIMELDTLHEYVDIQRKGAIYKAIPSPGSILAPNPYLVALRLAEAAATSYMNYQNAQNEILLGFVEKKLEIDKHRLSALNAINEELFWRQWQIVRKHSLDDAWRAARSDCRELVAILSVSEQGDDSKELIYSFLKRNERRFEYLPIYWYYRMLYATTSSPNGQLDDCDVQDAIRSGEMFDKRHREILRKDRIRALVSMMMIGAKKDKMSDTEMQRHLDIITRNTKTQDWDLAYFVAREYISHERKDKAIEVLKGMVDNLETLHYKFAMSDKVFDITSMKMLEPVRKKGTMEEEQPKASFPSQGLFLCRTLLNRLLCERDGESAIQAVARLASASGREKKNVTMPEKLFYALLLESVPDAVRNELKRVSIVQTKDGFRIGALKPWIIGEKEKVRVRVRAWKKESNELVDLTPDFSQNTTTGCRYDVAESNFGDVICVSNLRVDEFSKVELEINYGGTEVVRFIYDKLQKGTTPPTHCVYGNKTITL